MSANKMIYFHEKVRGLSSSTLRNKNLSPVIYEIVSYSVLAKIDIGKYVYLKFSIE